MIKTFQNINNFMESMLSYTDELIKHVVIYFENKSVSFNKYEKAIVQPVFIILKCENKNIYLNHKQIYDVYMSQLNVSVSDKIGKNLPKDKNALCEVVIQNERKIFEDHEYYPTTLFVCTNQKNIENIRKQIISSDHIEENEIPIDVF